MTKTDIKKARKALKRMTEIVKNDMLIKEEYVTPDVFSEELAKAGAVCQGHKACAIGSLWLGAGVKMQDNGYGEFEMPGVMEGYRERFFDYGHEDVRVAYDALNEAAARFIESNPRVAVSVDYNYEAEIEALFEGCYDETNHLAEDWQIGRDEMLEIIKDARSALKDKLEAVV